MQNAGASFSDVNVICTQREQPDGGELSKSDFTRNSDQNSIFSDTLEKAIPVTKKLCASKNALADDPNQKSEEDGGAVHAIMMTELSSNDSENLNLEPSTAAKPNDSALTRQNQLQSERSQKNLNLVWRDSDELFVLPINATRSLSSTVSPNKGVLILKIYNFNKITLNSVFSLIF